MLLVSGNNQTGVVGAELSVPVVARVTDSSGSPVPGQIINFRVAAGGGGVFAGTAISDATGTAQERWTLGTIAGPQRLEARAVDAKTGAPIVFASFDATAVAGSAASVIAVAGSGQTAVAGAALPAPLTVRVTDAYGNAVRGVEVEFAVTAGLGTVSLPAGTTDSGGRVSSSWTLGPQAGTQTVEARVTGLEATVFSATATQSGPAKLMLVSGDGQVGEVGSELGLPVVVMLADFSGLPLGAQPIAFEVMAGGGAPVLSVVNTGPDGRAQVSWQLGTTVAPQQLQVRATDPATGLPLAPISVAALALPGPAAAISVASGNSQSAQQLTPLPYPVRAWVVDAYGNSVPRAQVAFAAEPGSGSASPSVVPTNDFGIAESTWTLGASLGQQTLRAMVPGAQAATFTAIGTVGPPQLKLTVASGAMQAGVVNSILASPIVVRVEDLQGAPVAGQVVSFRIASGGGSLPAGSLVTSPDGIASVTWQLGTSIYDQQLLQVSTLDPISGLTVGPIAVSAMALAGPPAIGNLYPTSSPEVFPITIALGVWDAFGNAVSGAAVSYLPGLGCGTVAPTDSVTDNLGQSTAVWTAGYFAGVQTLQAAVAGLPLPVDLAITTTFQQLLYGSYQGVQVTAPYTTGDASHCPNGPLSLMVVGEFVLVSGYSFPSGGVLPDGTTSFSSDTKTTFHGAFAIDSFGSASGSGTIDFAGQANGWASCSGTWSVSRL